MFGCFTYVVARSFEFIAYLRFNSFLEIIQKDQEAPATCENYKKYAANSMISHKMQNSQQ
jgi:hypothetical protein